MSFNLWERDLNINVKNFTLENPENTLFKVIDHKWEDLYRWSYFLQDIKKLKDESLDLSFSTLHCNYKIKLNVNPNNYQKNIDISYKYTNSFKCALDVKPESARSTMEISQSNIAPSYNISLNDLALWHYVWAFIFWLFLVIALMIRRMDKKWLLLQNRFK